MRSKAARVPSVDPSLMTMISLGAENPIVSSRSTTAVTVAASLNTGTMIETRASDGVAESTDQEPGTDEHGKTTDLFWGLGKR